MPIYRKGVAWRVVVWQRGQRYDRLCRGSIEEAQFTEERLREDIHLAVDASPDERIRHLAKNRVYFMQISTGQIKIGRAYNVDARLKEIQVAHPYPVVLLGSFEADRIIERMLHAHFAHLRIRGEWFRPHPDLLAFIREPNLLSLLGTDGARSETTEQDSRGLTRLSRTR